MAKISDFKANLLGGGARPNQFLVELAFPSYVTGGAIAGQRAQFLCKAASLPSITIDPIQLQYRGRPVNVAGERSFQPWNVTIINDTSFAIRDAFERWSDGIQNFNSTDGKTNPIDYQVDLSVHQLDRSGAIIKSYRFVDAMPTDIGAIGLDFDATGIEQFDVNFVYNYYESNTNSNSSGFGVGVNIQTPVGSFPL